MDIGDVDLIVCFDAHKSPIRLVQRMGRTGRKREGRIVMLVTKGKEEQVREREGGREGERESAGRVSERERERGRERERERG